MEYAITHQDKVFTPSGNQTKSWRKEYMMYVNENYSTWKIRE